MRLANALAVFDGGFLGLEHLRQVGMRASDDPLKGLVVPVAPVQGLRESGDDVLDHGLVSLRCCVHVRTIPAR